MNKNDVWQIISDDDIGQQGGNTRQAEIPRWKTLLWLLVMMTMSSKLSNYQRFVWVSQSSS
jgi:hypothetical protein